MRKAELSFISTWPNHEKVQHIGFTEGGARGDGKEESEEERRLADLCAESRKVALG